MKCAHVFLLLVAAYLLDLCLAIGRNPTAVEHNACRVKWAEQLNEVKRVYQDERARIYAFNKGLDGFPCMTACRVSFRGNYKDMEDIFTPDDVQCSQGAFPRFCQKGRCILPAKYRTGGSGQQPLEPVDPATGTGSDAPLSQDVK